VGTYDMLIGWSSYDATFYACVKVDTYQFQMDMSWSIHMGAATALEDQATTYPVTCLGHVRVL
jgi:hypothetical protein